MEESFPIARGNDDVEELQEEELTVDEIIVDDALVVGDVSILNTLAVQGSPRSFRILGTIKRSSCVVLIDSESTHNFISPSIVEKLQLPTEVIKLFHVYIGNDDTLMCSTFAQR